MLFFCVALSVAFSGMLPSTIELLAAALEDDIPE
jgi:hypothetical protein